MSPPGTFERVYAAIRESLRSGRYRPGERIEPAVLSDELNASVTPVRDALHRLTGERVVEAPRHEGFRMPLMTETMLRQLYNWHLDLLLLAAISHGGVRDEASSSASDLQASRDAQSLLFASLARATGNPEHEAALEAVTLRIAPVRRLEHLFLGDAEGETASILRCLEMGDRRKLRSCLTLYHRRRQKAVPELIAALLRQ